MAPGAAWKADGRINAIATSVSIVAWGMAQSSGQHRSAKHIKIFPTIDPVIDAHDIAEPRTQRRQRDDELRRISERGVEESPNPFAQAFRELFGSSTQPSRKWQNGKAGCRENEEVPPRNEEFQGYRNWNKEASSTQSSRLS